ncbi:hypothetical protein LTR36_008451 [Oleoguttula mirabilis]|uniref:Uncharacterized protein n=1 Tax=Oleoguttula mirabilis TaxID=1507867 RepID=A0AAV9J7I7_9PEZI|nr:hypothetical protein LTR36_008451 [Oleoguttula mirabilis]
MAAPPNLPPLPSDLLLSVTHPFSDGQFFSTMNTHTGDDTSAFLPPPPGMPSALQANAGTELAVPAPPAPEPPRGESRSRSRSRSASEHSASDREDSEGEDNEQPRRRWRQLVEDESTPCEDELAYIASKEEHDALKDRAWFEEQTYFPLYDSAFKAAGSGRIIWQIDRFNGTKEEPNNEYIMRSPVVHVGGYDWRIKFFPRGNNTDHLSVYLECVTMQTPEFEEYEELERPPFPYLKGSDGAKIRKRRSIAAQVSVAMFNPYEPRSCEFKSDAHRFSKQSADYGWRYFTHREDFHLRRHGQRQAILRDDQLAFCAYIRVVDDPTGCMWEHDDDGSYESVVLATGLRPFACQSPLLAGVIPLLHFAPFRNFLLQYKDVTRMAYELQRFLYKMFTRTSSQSYGRRTESEQADAITWLRKVSRMLREESADPAAVTEMIGNLDAESGAAVRSNRLATKDCRSIQEAVNKHPTPLKKPMLLTLELHRQEFDRKERKWNKLTNKVEVDDVIQVGETWYNLYAITTHCGDLQSNKHSVYVRPGRFGTNWYAYEDCKVTAVTRKQAVVAHQGVDKDADQRHDSPFAGFHDRALADDEVIYAVMYIRNDMASVACAPYKEEAWDVPEAIEQHKDFPEPHEKQPTCTSEREESDLPLRAEQERFERELQARAAHAAELLAEAGAATPEWPLTDEEGDVVMSDVDDDASQHSINLENLAASTYLAKIPTTPSYTHKWHVTFDCLGRDYYSGQMLGSDYHGEGHLIAMNGDEYTGSFSRGKQQGVGRMVYASTSNIYEGEWHDGQHHGHGMLTEAANGNVFEGGWENGKKHGQFVLKGSVTEEDKSCCTICYANEITTAFYDCGHVVACKDCAARMDNCPICRRRVVGRLQIYGVKMTLE